MIGCVVMRRMRVRMIPLIYPSLPRASQTGRMEDTPKKHCLNYIIKKYRRSEETRKARAGFDAESTEDHKSKRVRTGACQENLTGKLRDSMVHRLSAMSTLISRGLVVLTVISKGH